MPKKDPTVKVSSAAKAAVRPIPLAPISPGRLAQLETFLRETLPELRRVRAERTSLIDTRWSRTLAGVRYKAAPRRAASNLSVPLTIWAAAGARARLYEGIFGSLPLVTVTPYPGSSGFTVEDAKALGSFLQAEILNPRALNGRAAGEKVIAEVANYGTSALKVCKIPDDVVQVHVAGKPTERLVPGRIRWEHISFHDLLYWNGYGTDTQAMPYVGHEFQKAWADIERWGALGYYDSKAVEAVKAFYGSLPAGQSGDRVPEFAQPHDLAEIYLAFPLKDDDNTPAALVVDWHSVAERSLRVAWSPTGEIRPIFVAQFDYNPDATRLEGQGVCEKLAGAQDETDAVHNIAIEAGKRAAAHLVGVRYTSQAERDLGGGDDVIPGDVYSSENPDEDVSIKQLGDPNAALAALQLEEHTRLYVTRILGLDESRMGNMESAKRVASAVGQIVAKESRVVMQRALSSMGQVLTDACYVTMDLEKDNLPVQALVAAVGRDAAGKLMSTVFAPSESTTREQLILTVTAQDAATSQESKKQELLILTQFLFGFYDKLVQYGATAIQLPPPVQRLLLAVMTKMENAVRALLGNVDSIQNADEVLPDLAQMIEALNRMSQAMGGGPGPGGVITPGAPGTGEPLEEADGTPRMGAGIT